MSIWRSLSVGRVTEGLKDAVIAPRVIKPRRVVVYLNGANGTASEAVGYDGLPAVLEVTKAIASNGMIVVAPTVTQTWGNATAIARIDSAIAYARAALAGSDDSPILVGGSHGAVCALTYASTHEVAAVVGMIPAVDLEYLRDEDVLGQRDDIDTAFGITYPEELPTGKNPFLTDPGCPVQLWYANDDEVSTNIQEYASLRSAEIHDVGAHGHTNAAIAAVDLGEMIDFMIDQS